MTIRRTGVDRPEVLVVGASALTMALSALEISGQEWIPVGVLLLSAPCVVVSPRARNLVLVLGGLLAFQSSVGLSLLKAVYFSVASVALFAAIARLNDLRDWRAVDLMKPMIVTSTMFAGVVLFSLTTAAINGTALSESLRDAAPYLLFCAVPIFALDVGTSESRSYLVAILVAVGLLTALSWTVEWAGGDKRNYLQFPMRHFLLPSSLLASALVCFATSQAITLSGLPRIGWIALSGCLVAVLGLITGTRSELVLILVPLIVVFALPGRVGVKMLGVAAFSIGAFTVALAVALLVLQVTGTNPQILVDRFSTVGQLLNDPNQDASYRLRGVAFETALSQFLSSPIVGFGPGHPFNLASVSDAATVSAFNVDTGMELPAKFGVLGLSALAASCVALILVVKRMALIVGGAASRAALIAFSSLGAVSFYWGSTLEDKGFSFGLILMLGLVLAYRPATGTDVRVTDSTRLAQTGLSQPRTSRQPTLL